MPATPTPSQGSETVLTLAGPRSVQNSDNRACCPTIPLEIGPWAISAELYHGIQEFSGRPLIYATTDRGEVARRTFRYVGRTTVTTNADEPDPTPIYRPPKCLLNDEQILAYGPPQGSNHDPDNRSILYFGFAVDPRTCQSASGVWVLSKADLNFFMASGDGLPRGLFSLQNPGRP